MNTEYVVRLAEALRPYRTKWLEDYLLPEDMESYFRVRQRIPWQTLASGEHWYSIHPFARYFINIFTHSCYYSYIHSQLPCSLTQRRKSCGGGGNTGKHADSPKSNALGKFQGVLAQKTRNGIPPPDFVTPRPTHVSEPMNP